MKGKTKIPEGKLLKALQELEDSVEKGDALEDADPEGGLSTEGEPLSGAAPSGRGESTRKSRGSDSSSEPASSSSSSSEEDDDEDASEMMSSKKFPPKKGKKGVRKAGPDRASSSSSSDDEDDDAEKSFREVAEGDEVVRKALRVNEFLEGLVDQLSLSLGGVPKSVAKMVAKSLGEMEDRLRAHVDEAVAKSVAGQREFNARLARAVAAIGNTVQDDLVSVVKSLSDMPVSAPRGKAVLSKGEVNQPPWAGPRLVNADQRLADGADEYVSELSEVPVSDINDWLFKKSMTNQIDQKLLMAFEADHYDVSTLPAQIRKAIANDLCK